MSIDSDALTGSPVTPVQRSQVVAVCQGRRCQALLAGHRQDAMEVLRQATRRSRSGILVSTGCAGPCSHAPVIVVGTGESSCGELEVRADAVLGPVGAADVQVLATHLQEPSTAGLPPSLDHVRLGLR